MSEDSKNLKSTFIGRSSLSLDGKSGHVSKEKHYAHFGIERASKIVRRFKLILRTGYQMSVPYAFLPLFILEDDAALKIKTRDLTILIKGRGLGILDEYLSLETVRWIKESPSLRDDGETAAFVSEIIIDGDLDL